MKCGKYTEDQMIQHGQPTYPNKYKILKSKVAIIQKTNYKEWSATLQTKSHTVCYITIQIYIAVWSHLFVP